MAGHHLPPLLQSVQAESGAVALGILLASHGRISRLSEISAACGLTRSGITPEKLLQGAQSFALEGNWEQLGDSAAASERIQSLKGPAITVNNRNRYSVILGSEGNTAQIYDTALGRQQQPLDSFDHCRLLKLTPTENFVCKQQPAYWRSCLHLIIPLQREAIALLLLATGSVVPTLMIAACSSQFIDQFIEQKRLSFGIPIVWLALIASSLMIGMSLLSNLLTRRMSYVLERRMALDIFEILFSRSLAILKIRNIGDMASRMMYPYYLPQQAFFSFFTPALGLWTSCLVIIFSAFISLPLFLILSANVIIILVISYQMTVTVNDNLIVRQKANSARFATGFQLISNLETLKGGGTEYTMLEQWHNHLSEVIKQNQIIGRQKVIRNVSINGLIFIARVMLLGIGGFLIIQGNVSLGSLLAFLFIQEHIAASLDAIPAISNGWQSLQGMLLLYDDLKQTDCDPWLSCFQRTITAQQDKTAIEPLTLELVDAGHRFSRLDQPVLSKINLQIKQGEQLLLRGASGAGKTVLIQMLSHLLHPSEGKLLVNGQSIMDIDSRHWHKNVHYIDRNTALFEGTIMENITIWRSSCQQDDAINAVDVVGLTKWIQRFEEGFEHYLDNADQILCNSQKLQMSIARALCARPRVLLMDLNTGELRREDEERIYHHCRHEGITVVGLSERGGASQGYDRILKLEGGTLM